jgi:hypothetical protein
MTSINLLNSQYTEESNHGFYRGITVFMLVYNYRQMQTTEFRKVKAANQENKLCTF